MRAKARQKRAAAREETWREFAQQPGTHLLWEGQWGWRGNQRGGELRTAEQQTIAAVRGSPSWEHRLTVSAGGRSFTAKKVMIPLSWPRSWPPGLAEILRQPEASSPKLTHAVVERVESLRELVDETGTLVLYTYGKHFNFRAEAGITFHDRRWLEFPVRGVEDPVMTAVDQDGNKVAEYRFLRGLGTGITVHRDWTLTDELMLVIAISAPWLDTYFNIPPDPWAGGGG